MEILGGILAGLVLMALLAGVGIAALVALAFMVALHFLTEMSFRKVFLISSGIGLLAPIFLGLAISGAIADGSLERDLRSEMGEFIQLPEDAGERWAEALPKLREIGEASERGELSEDEAEARVREILGEFEDLQIGIDINGDGVVIGGNGDSEDEDAADPDAADPDANASDTGVPLELPEPVEAQNGSEQ
ncbi:hypothetical protein [uncultured Erythrobacter sp.]|uniref:hypothetical protein n=1 Tax=uncultured Erythrobacter sp. TaxID=263913 RepID=UPI0026279C18|nr:hypothetical protein [uncultured Erythrobacter sp.]